MMVQQYEGRGRTAVLVPETSRGGWIYRLYMAWFARAGGGRNLI
jgi:hypothetical protein